MSQFGHQLERAELYSTDEFGKPIAKPDRHANLIPVHETRPTPNSTQGYAEREEAQRTAVAFVASLTERERELFELQEAPQGQRLEQRTFNASEEEAQLQAGWELVRHGKGTVDMVKVFTEQLDNAAIAERMGITDRQLRTVIQSLNRKRRECK